jgi:hypothetical protein
VQLAPQRNKLLSCNQVEMIPRQLESQLEARSVRVELRELQRDAFGHGAGAHADRVELLDDPQDLLDLAGFSDDLGHERGGNILEALAEIAVVIDRVDDRAADQQRTRIQVCQLQLPEQVVGKGLPGLVRQVQQAVVVATRPWRIGFGRRRLRPVLANLDGRFLAAFFRGILGSLLGRPGEFLQRQAVLGLLLGLEHHVALERFEYLGLQLDRRQLQQADGLLQLGRHRELLPDTELQGRLHHAVMSAWRVCLRSRLVAPVPCGARSETEILTQVDLADVRIGKDLFRSTGRQNRALVHDVGSTADAEGLADVVVGDQHADSPIGEVAHDALDVGD